MLSEYHPKQAAMVAILKNMMPRSANEQAAVSSRLECMKSILKTFLGANPVAFINLATLNPKRFVDASGKAFSASREASIGIPDIRLGDVLGERRPSIRLSVMRYVDGALKSEEAMSLLAILVAENPAEVLEIGTFMGGTTLQMADNLPCSIVHTVDLPPNFNLSLPDAALALDDFHLIAHRTVGKEFLGHPCAIRIRQHFCDTAKWNFAEAGNPSFFFIDGSHTYEYCKNDSEKCYEVSRSGSVFLWHDCDARHPGVINVLREWRRAGRDIRRIIGTRIAYWKRP